MVYNLVIYHFISDTNLVIKNIFRRFFVSHNFNFYFNLKKNKI